MVEIKPFRGIRYNLATIKDMAQVATEPYDKIGSELQKKYYDQSPYNFCRIILGVDEPNDNETLNKYQRAARNFSSWQNEGTLIKDPDDSIYLYEQTFSYENGPTKTRRAFIAMVKIEENPDIIRPHENTLSGPKADRLKLLQATGADLEQIFVLYEDEKNQIATNLKDAYLAAPVFTYTDHLDVEHKFWRVSDTAIIQHVQQQMINKDLFIADGHHRYETYVNYKKEQLAKNTQVQEFDAYNYCMMTFIAMEDPGLTILPTHRMVKNLEDFKTTDFLAQLQEKFELTAYPLASEQQLLKDLSEKTRSFALTLASSDKLYLIQLKADKISAGELDVTILHQLILENILGIDKEKLALQTNVFYKRSAEGTFREIKQGNYQLGFILNPTGINQVKSVARAGEKMPQKSTDFYPKIASGLVIADVSSATIIK